MVFNRGRYVFKSCSIYQQTIIEFPSVAAVYEIPVVQKHLQWEIFFETIIQ